MLRKGIEGKSQIEAANRIINFVQTAFEYKTDQDQFGYERSLFGDETFWTVFANSVAYTLVTVPGQMAIGLFIGYIYKKNHDAKTIGDAEMKAKNLILDAETRGEALQKEPEGSARKRRRMRESAARRSRNPNSAFSRKKKTSIASSTPSRRGRRTSQRRKRGLRSGKRNRTKSTLRRLPSSKRSPAIP